MAFFDTTPVGRILNRFSKDIYVIDEMLPRTMGYAPPTVRSLNHHADSFTHTHTHNTHDTHDRFFLMMFFGSVGIMVVIAMVTPFFLCAFIPLGFVYHYMQQVTGPSPVGDRVCRVCRVCRVVANAFPYGSTTFGLRAS
jgi:ABC-type multidrug transport system fused ATPase/permease subunit